MGLSERSEHLWPHCCVHLTFQHVAQRTEDVQAPRPGSRGGGAVRICPRAVSLTFLYSSSCSGLTRMTWHMRLPSFVRGSCGMGSSVDMTETIV
jgi:hypothetical protein